MYIPNIWMCNRLTDKKELAHLFTGYTQIRKKQTENTYIVFYFVTYMVTVSQQNRNDRNLHKN